MNRPTKTERLLARIEYLENELKQTKEDLKNSRNSEMHWLRCCSEFSQDCIDLRRELNGKKEQERKNDSFLYVVYRKIEPAEAGVLT